MLELRISKLKTLLRMLGLCALAASGYWLTTNPDPRRSPTAALLGWLLVAVSALVAGRVIRQLFRTGPQLVISEIGIDDRRSRLGLIPWAEVTAAKAQIYPGGSSLSFTTADLDMWRARLGPSGRLMLKVRRAMGLSEFNVAISDLERSPSAIVDTVRHHLGRRLAV
jgi:hypothetical protein